MLMHGPRRGVLFAVGACLAACLGGAPLFGSGFSATEPSVKAMGLAGAFAARADDPTAGFYNPGALALVKKGKLTAGLVPVSLNESQYQGLPPGLGASTAAEQEQSIVLRPHAFALLPLSPKLKLGIGAYTPFAFKNEWANPGSFAGRYLSTNSELQTYDVNTNLAWQVSPSFGIGFGAIYRTSRLTMGRRLGANNPSGGGLVDVGSFGIESEWEAGIGWDVGFLNKIGDRFSWGASYRSPIEIDTAGAGRLSQVLTGNAQLDALNRATLPYDTDLPISTTLQFPATATFAVGFAPSEKSWIEVDVTQTSWSDFEGLSVVFPSQASFSQNVQGPWEDALSYRLGIQLGLAKDINIRLGYGFEESPVPDDSLGPFFPDSERSIFSAGIGRDWLDVGFQLIAPDSRTTLTNAGNLNGVYSGNTYLLGISVTKK
ncbi:MAG TPA: outer membrane protein transport protein [Thermoanaerobaculia bacterium]